MGWLGRVLGLVRRDVDMGVSGLWAVGCGLWVVCVLVHPPAGEVGGIFGQRKIWAGGHPRSKSERGPRLRLAGLLDWATGAPE